MMDTLTPEERGSIVAALEQQVHDLERRLEGLNDAVDTAHAVWRGELQRQQAVVKGLELTRTALEKINTGGDTP